MKTRLKSLMPYLISILGILIFSCILFYPQLDGKIIQAGDSTSSIAKSKHILDFVEDEGSVNYWNTAQFSGGPIFMLGLGKNSNLLGNFTKLFTLGYSHPIGMFFAIGLIMFFSLRLLNINTWLSFMLSIAYMLSLMFFSLVEAGHDSKIYTLLYLPFVLSGVILFFKNKYLKGALALLLGTSLSIYSGHVQMVYYFIIALVAFGIPIAIFNLKGKKAASFLISVGLAILIAVIAAGTNFAQLKTSNDFSKETMRGGGVLPKEDVQDTKASSGLKWDYAMSWSYEVEDFLNIIIPRVVGGGSQEMVDKKNPIAKLMIQNKAKVKNGKVGIPGYWSSMPFTSGGAYIGAVMFFLFILSLFLMKKEYSIAFISAFLIIMLLSLGENASWFNRFLFNNFPLFDKFRAPSSAISILPIFITIGASLGFDRFLKEKNILKNIDKKLYFALVTVVGILVLVWIMGISSFSFLSPNDVNYDAKIQEILKDGRMSLFLSDLKRTFLFILVASILIFLYIKNKIKSEYAFIGALTFLMILDGVVIAKRYVTEDNFVSANKYKKQFAPRAVDLQIEKLEPNGRGFYRVYDLSVNTFNDAKPSYYHNQIGGYDPTKLQRYQDLIERHISQNNQEVLSMLNTKYIISREGQLQTNPNAFGNAWFVKDVNYVSSDVDEINSLKGTDLRNTVIINQNDYSLKNGSGDGSGSIGLTSYSPSKLVYKSNSLSAQLAVFSEVWYGGDPGWKISIDNQEVDFLRANYVLRALEIPAGEHEIIMEFIPKAKGAWISLVCSIIGLFIILAAALHFFGIITLFESKNEEIDQNLIID